MIYDKRRVDFDDVIDRVSEGFSQLAKIFQMFISSSSDLFKLRHYHLSVNSVQKEKIL